MADGGGGASGILGVMIGAMLVVFVGVAFLYGTGKMGGPSGGPSLTIKMPGTR